MRPDFCSRRSFLGAAAAGGLAMTFGKCLAAPDALLIEEPASGAVLHRRHGRPSDDGLEIEVRGVAPLEQSVLVNGRPAQ